MAFILQPHLENESVLLEPLKSTDFEELYRVASDPKVWEQHPNRDRWKREVFQTFFEGALQSGGAFKVIDKVSNEVIGSTRFYEYDVENCSVLIGYTFYGTAFWGKGINPLVKTLMLDHAFQFVDKVYFHIGAENYRSQTAIGRLGARLIGEQDVAYFGEPAKHNHVYLIEKKDWRAAKAM